MITSDSKPYLSYLNNLVNEYNNTYHHSINKKPVNDDYYALNTKIETSPNVLKIGNWSREIFVIDSVLKNNPWTYKHKHSNGEKIKGSFHEKEFLCSIL